MIAPRANVDATHAPRSPDGASKAAATFPLDWRLMVQVQLHLLGFAAATLLMVWGLFALFFLAIGGFSFDGLVHQLHNLTSRYLAAEPERVAGFRSDLVAAHLILAAILIILRRRTLLPALETEGRRDA